MWPNLLFWLLVGHAVADYALQSEAMARGKNRAYLSTSPHVPPWWIWLGSHSMIHGGAVALVLGDWRFGVAEAVCHSLIDFGKCEGKYGIKVDQAAHVACKVLWLVLFVGWLKV